MESPESPYQSGGLVLPGGSPASASDFTALAASAEYILIGERHDNPVDHKVQAELVAMLAREGRSPALGLEMLPRNRFDGALGEFSRKKLGVDDLPAALDWQRSWGFDFALYRPIFEAAGEYSIPVHGLNIPNSVRLGVSRKGLGGLSAAEKKELPRRIIPPEPAQREKLAVFFSRHGAMIAQSRAAAEKKADMPPVAATGSGAVASPAVERSAGKAGEIDPFERFLLIQSLWDSTMAEQAAYLRKKRQGPGPFVILAGGGHVEHGYGIASRLKLLDPDARRLLVMPFSGPKPELGAADLFYYSPQVEAPRRGRLGLTLAKLDGKLRIMGVEPGSRAEQAGLMAGDVLERAGSFVVSSPGDLHKAALEAKKHERRLSIAVQRDGKMLAFYVGGEED